MLSDHIKKDIFLERSSIFKRECSLIAGDQVIGTMIFPGWFSSTAEVEMFNNRWEIKKESIWKDTLGIYERGYELPFAKYYTEPSGGNIVELPKGNIVNIHSSILKLSTEVKTASGDLLFRVENKLRWKKIDTKFIILKKSELLDENPWLLMLIPFIDSMRHSRSVAAD